MSDHGSNESNTEPESADDPVPPPAKEPRLCHSDLGMFVPQPICDQDKFRLIQEHFVPPPTYKFPQSANKRSFQHRWLTRFQWLRYSQQNDGGYCLACALFFKPSMNMRSDPGVLVKKPLTNFQKALEILNKHDSKEFHKFSVVRMSDFIKVMSNQQLSIRSSLNQATAQQIATNRLKLNSIVETVLLCARQNIPLRGHRS